MARLHKWRWILGTVAALAVVALCAPLLYNRFIATPAPTELALPPAQSSSAASKAFTNASALDGEWNVGSHSIVGYRATVHALGFQQTFVGRTGKVWGSIKVANGLVAGGSFTVGMSSFSGSSRERQVADTKTYPTATFVLTRSFKVSSAGGTAQRYSACGNLVLRGRTIPVTLIVSQERKGSALFLLADCQVAFGRWHVPVPFGVKGRGTVEILLGLVRTAGNTASAAS